MQSARLSLSRLQWRRGAPHRFAVICCLPFVCSHVEIIPFAPSVLDHLFGSQMSLACAYEMKYKLAIITNAKET